MEGIRFSKNGILETIGLMNENIAETLVEFAQSLYERKISQPLRKQIIELMIDKIGLILGWAHLPASLAVYRSYFRFPVKGRARVGYFGELVSPEQAAFINAFFGHAQEVDDSYMLSITHPGGIVIPAALAVADEVGAAPQHVLSAVAGGMEIMLRVSHAIPIELQKKFDPSLTAGLLGAAMAASLLLGLDKIRCLNALCIAASFSGGLVKSSQINEAEAPHCAIAAGAGVRAAYFAKCGLVGPVSILDGTPETRNLFGAGFQRGKMTQKLGEEFLLQYTSLKKYNCSYFIHGVLDAVLDLRSERALNEETIDRVDIYVAEEVLRQVGAVEWPKTIKQRQKSLNFSVCFAIVHGVPGAHSFNEAPLQDEKIRKLFGKVYLREDMELSQIGGNRLPSTVRITFTSGEQLRRQVLHPRGTFPNLLSTEEVAEKFIDTTSGVMSMDGAVEMIKQVRDFDRLACSRQLTDNWALCPQQACR